MQVVESIKKARGKGVSDDLILQEIRKQNPDKETFFQKAQERGATPARILDEIIKQNSHTTSIEIPVPIPPPQQHTDTTPIPVKHYNQTTDKTILTKEAQIEEENMRQNFLKRIEAKERGESVGGEDFFSSQPASSTDSSQEMSGEINSEKKPFPKIIVVLVIGVFLLLAFAFLIFSLF